MFARGAGVTPAAELVVGLVNNMAPATRRTTEQQFAGILAAASRTLDMRVRLLAVENLSGGTADALRALQEARPDALIVTGAEPQCGSLAEEPLWPALARLADWAAEHTTSAIWSCMAAHMVVYRLDRISRRRLPQKLSGVFACRRMTNHGLLANAPAAWTVPHSRRNGLDEMELRGNGYTILSHGGPRVGPDSFVRQAGGSLFLMLQGHPEYGRDSLRGEYRRDVRRYLAGRRDSYPDVPHGYFDEKTTAALTELRLQAGRVPDAALLAALDAAVAVAPDHAWHGPAVRLFANWLTCLAQRKAARDAAALWPMRQRQVAS